MRFDFRPLTRADLPLLFEWHQRSHVLEWWDAYASIDALKADTLESDAHAFLACIDDEPIAYIQWYACEENGIAGIDQFIADPASIGRGVGTDLVSQFVDFLFSDSAVRAVIVDPLPHNARAIRCYEKAGFRFVAMKDGAHVMRRDR